MTVRLILGDCRDVLRTLDACSVDAIVTDPPYELGFMGKGWDKTGVANDITVWRECLRVLKPGGHLLAFGGTRTYHRMVCAIEDAGFEIRDQLGWVYGSGFPKSLDVSKAIDKAAGAEREVVGYDANRARPNKENFAKRTDRQPSAVAAEGWKDNGATITAPATEAARHWQGWGTALKPAWEPIVMARRPLVGTVAANVLQHGTGALNIDGCRIGSTVETWPASRSYAPGQMQPGHAGDTQSTGAPPPGRWPANLIHDGSDEVLAAFPQAPGQMADVSDTAPSAKTSNVYGAMARAGEPSSDSDNEGVVGFKMKPGARRLDSGSAARFFYCAKADAADRNDGLPERGNHHPTVKPTDLMRWLCRLVTPPGGTVLDPFMGSGSTLKAAELEGFSAIGIEREAEYIAIARRRIAADAPLFAEVA